MTVLRRMGREKHRWLAGGGERGGGGGGGGAGTKMDSCIAVMLQCPSGFYWNKHPLNDDDNMQQTLSYRDKTQSGMTCRTMGAWSGKTATSPASEMSFPTGWAALNDVMRLHINCSFWHSSVISDYDPCRNARIQTHKHNAYLHGGTHELKKILIMISLFLSQQPHRDLVAKSTTATSMTTMQ